MKIPRVTLMALIKAAPSPASAKKAPAPTPAIKGRPRTATKHTGFLSVQRALQKKK